MTYRELYGEIENILTEEELDSQVVFTQFEGSMRIRLGLKRVPNGNILYPYNDLYLVSIPDNVKGFIETPQRGIISEG